MRNFDVGDKDLSVAIVGDFALCSVNQRGKGDAKTDCDKEFSHVFGALTVGKRAFLISSFRSLPSTDIR